MMQSFIDTLLVFQLLNSLFVQCFIKTDNMTIYEHLSCEFCWQVGTQCLCNFLVKMIHTFSALSNYIVMSVVKSEFLVHIVAAFEFVFG